MPEPLRLVQPRESPLLDLAAVERSLSDAPPEAVLEWSAQTFGNAVIASSSFGAESAVMLSLVTKVLGRVPIVFVDTGYLFAETYQFAEELRQRFDLDLRVYSPALSTARLEALHGKLWEGDEQSLTLYQQITKVEPMDRALRELAPQAWLAGLRGGQTQFRRKLRVVEEQNGVYKVHPILRWDDETIFRYLRSNDLPYHPLYRRGYRSIGDVHSTQPTPEGSDPRAGRRLGVHSECGLHLPRGVVDASLKSSGL